MLQITTATGDRETAERIAAALVERRLAACAQVSGPIESTYLWEGRVETSREWLCTAKTLPDRFAQIEQVVTELHPYDTPELIATPVAESSEKYRRWLRDVLGEE